MPDDERESDDLFEDLDKFFAPIKDVDWDEPEEPAPPADSPGDEHVVVRSGSEAVVTGLSTAGQTPGTGPTFEDDDEEDRRRLVRHRVARSVDQADRRRRRGERRTRSSAPPRRWIAPTKATRATSSPGRP